MKRQMMLAGAIVWVAASETSFSTVADAALVRHHFVRHAVAHRGGEHRHVVHREYLRSDVWVGGGWTGDNSTRAPISANGLSPWMGGSNPICLVRRSWAE